MKGDTANPSKKDDSQSDRDNVDRIVLRRAEGRKLDEWAHSLNAKYDGAIRFTKSDLANFLIRSHADSLDGAETDALAADLYDEVRWLNWALAKIRKAKKDGVQMSLDELVLQRKPTETEQKATVKRSRKSVAIDANESISPAPAADSKQSPL